VRAKTVAMSMCFGLMLGCSQTNMGIVQTFGNSGLHQDRVYAPGGPPASRMHILYTFSLPPDGRYPEGNQALDPSGNLYGVAYHGGPLDGGLVYKVNPAGKETVLHTFSGGYDDGTWPYAGVIRDSTGDLFGTASSGGPYTFGMVYKLDPNGNETILHWFNYTDGGLPAAGLIQDTAGNLYGTTFWGGTQKNGTIFKLDIAGNYVVLHNFTGADGSEPAAALFMDSSGNLYGTTTSGGLPNVADRPGAGVVFKLDPTGKETVLHNFNRVDGSYPQAGVVRDSAGNLYGATLGGGSSACGCGLVFKIDRSGKFEILHQFNGVDGSTPGATLLLTPSGDLYGTTVRGGSYNSGVIFKINSAGNETVLYNFVGDYFGGLGCGSARCADGAGPASLLIRDAAGNLYGNTATGGLFGFGVVYELTR
jgi:uncharacterized repeat protein (TIGR03803 family)